MGITALTVCICDAGSTRRAGMPESAACPARVRPLHLFVCSSQCAEGCRS